MPFIIMYDFILMVMCATLSLVSLNCSDIFKQDLFINTVP